MEARCQQFIASLVAQVDPAVRSKIVRFLVDYRDKKLFGDDLERALIPLLPPELGTEFEGIFSEDARPSYCDDSDEELANQSCSEDSDADEAPPQPSCLFILPEKEKPEAIKALTQDLVNAEDSRDEEGLRVELLGWLCNHIKNKKEQIETSEMKADKEQKRGRMKDALVVPRLRIVYKKDTREQKTSKVIEKEGEYAIRLWKLGHKDVEAWDVLQSMLRGRCTVVRNSLHELNKLVCTKLAKLRRRQEALHDEVNNSKRRIRELHQKQLSEYDVLMNMNLKKSSSEGSEKCYYLNEHVTSTTDVFIMRPTKRSRHHVLNSGV